MDEKTPLTVCWMSHMDDKVTGAAAEGFAAVLASTDSLPEVAAIRQREQDRNVYGVQFHPEVMHTPNNAYADFARNFPVYNICGAT